MGDIFIPGCQESLYSHIFDFQPCVSAGTAILILNTHCSNVSVVLQSSKVPGYLHNILMKSLAGFLKNLWKEGSSFPDSQAS